MECTTLLALTSCAALSCAASPPADVQPLIDNLAEPLRGNSLIFDDGVENLWAAQSFAADRRRYRLESIETILGTAVGPPVVVAELHDGDEPTGALRTTLSVPALSTAGNEVVALTPDSDVIIERGQALTLILGVANVAEYEWAYADSNNWIGPGTFGNYYYSSDAGATWTNFGADFPYYLRVNVTPICPADCNADYLLNVNDFVCFQTSFALGNMNVADCDDDGVLNVNDYVCFQTTFAIGCP